MNRSGWMVTLAALGLILAGCNHSSSGNGAAATVSEAPAKPSNSADMYAWGSYLAIQGKLHGKNLSMQPYIYVIPGGDSGVAKARRQSEMDSIVHGIGPILIPGGVLILGGPDAKQTTAFLNDIAKQIKTDALKGIAVMIVNDASEQAADTSALQASGATVRFVAM